MPLQPVLPSWHGRLGNALAALLLDLSPGHWPSPLISRVTLGSHSCHTRRDTGCTHIAPPPWLPRRRRWLPEEGASCHLLFSQQEGSWMQESRSKAREGHSVPSGNEQPRKTSSLSLLLVKLLSLLIFLLRLAPWMETLLCVVKAGNRKCIWWNNCQLRVPGSVQWDLRMLSFQEKGIFRMLLESCCGERTVIDILGVP